MPGPVQPGPRAVASYPTEYPAGARGFDISQYQCGHLPARPASVAVVQVSGGRINNPPNPCYRQEAAWAGSHMSAYIYMNGLPNPAPPESMRGPAAPCARTNSVCQAYDFGFHWARHWVAYSRGLGINPRLWWLDVEVNSGWTTTAVNDGVISGAVAGLRSEGVRVGLYSTPYQWAAIAGSLVFPGIPVWTAGAGKLDGPGYTATFYCRSGNYTFARGHLTMVQWGYPGQFAGAYPGSFPMYDQDYACPKGDVPGR